jgi:phosphoribosylformylglycinamidine cyclo-ligase
MLESSGVHTNGLTLCRAIAARLPQGYLTTLSDGRTFGEALLDPASHIYVNFITACQRAGIALHYAVHVTGHGWRKLMRLDDPFVYRITSVPEPLGIFQFLLEAGPIDQREAYATFNMGAGFAVYIDSKDADACVRIAGECGYHSWIAGSVVKDGNRKAVEIPSLGIVYDAESLQVR